GRAASQPAGCGPNLLVPAARGPADVPRRPLRPYLLGAGPAAPADAGRHSRHGGRPGAHAPARAPALLPAAEPAALTPARTAAAPPVRRAARRRPRGAAALRALGAPSHPHERGRRGGGPADRDRGRPAGA